MCIYYFRRKEVFAKQLGRKTGRDKSHPAQNILTMKLRGGAIPDLFVSLGTTAQNMELKHGVTVAASMEQE
jgi:hypothetical protein